MTYLFLVTFVWAFSFSLIAKYLAGTVDPFFSAFCRSFLAFLLFVPFLDLTFLSFMHALLLLSIGGVQLGLMYVFYYQSFLYLSVPEILVFTIFTPIYITLLYDLYHKKFSLQHMLSACLAVLGAALIRQTGISESFLQGFLCIQGANLCFAFGQVAYKVLLEKISSKKPQRCFFAYFYLGATLVTGLSFYMLADKSKLPSSFEHWLVLLWLGFVASGFGFFAWNKGASKVSSGQLAVMNNALIPVGLIVNIFFTKSFHMSWSFVLGSALIFLALFVEKISYLYLRLFSTASGIDTPERK